MGRNHRVRVRKKTKIHRRKFSKKRKKTKTVKDQAAEHRQKKENAQVPGRIHPPNELSILIIQFCEILKHLTVNILNSSAKSPISAEEDGRTKKEESICRRYLHKKKKQQKERIKSDSVLNDERLKKKE